jgi:hypothetical protein
MGISPVSRESRRIIHGRKIANAWLINPQLLRPSKYITALKMRDNVTADKASLARAKKGHRVQEMPYTKRDSGAHLGPMCPRRETKNKWA